MTTYTKIMIGGSEVTDAERCWVNKSIGENNQASSFGIELGNTTGENINNYVVGDEAVIYADASPNPTTKVFTGILEDKNFRGIELNEMLTLTGRDYSARLMDRTVEPEVYNSLPAGSIVRDIVVKYTDDINTGSIQDSTTIIDRIRFKHTPVFDAINQLAQISDYTFYVDNDKYLHFEPKNSISSGYVFDNTNTVTAKFKEQRDTVFNQIWVYGDRYLDGYKQTFTAVGGSVFNLLYNPHNTSITVGGSIWQPGAIEEVTFVPTSGIKYMVSYDNSRITFVSGTGLGNWIPASGASVIITYDRALPIVKVGDNEISKAKYGTRIKTIQDTDIKDPKTAEIVLKTALNEYAEPAKEGDLDIRGVVNVTPGNTCIVNIPYHEIVNQQYNILEANYDFNERTILSDQCLSVRVNKKIPDITDTIKELLLAIKNQQNQNILDTDILTRFQFATGSMGVRQSGCIVYGNSVTGSCFHLFDTNFIPPINPFRLASGTNQGFLSGSPVGAPFTPLSILWSGGYT